jgi:hypothetical protein
MTKIRRFWPRAGTSAALPSKSATFEAPRRRARSVMAKARRIGFVGYPGLTVLDLLGPYDTFATANAVCGRGLYETVIVGSKRAAFVSDSGVTLTPHEDFATAGRFDTLITPGGRVFEITKPRARWPRGSSSRPRTRGAWFQCAPACMALRQRDCSMAAARRHIGVTRRMRPADSRHESGSACLGKPWKPSLCRWAFAVPMCSGARSCADSESRRAFMPDISNRNARPDRTRAEYGTVSARLQLTA